MINTNNSQLKKRVMRRVYLICYTRKLLSLTALKLYASVLLVWGLLYNVSVTDVVHNTMAVQSMSSLSYFYKYAFMNTELIVQISSVLFLGLAFIVIRDLFKKGMVSWGRV